MSNIAFIDSGIGGVAILRQVKRLLPRQDCVYYCDNANFPYGVCTSAQLVEFACRAVDKLATSFALSVVVLACNTLTACAVDELRVRYPSLTFVGTEPAVKQALQYTASCVTVGCTCATASSARIASRFSSHNVHFLPFPHLAQMIENNESRRNLVSYVSEVLSQSRTDSDCLVLGCTHYLLIKDVFSQVLLNRKLFDGASGVAQRVKTLVGKKGANGGVTSIVLSRADSAKQAQLLELLR